MRETNLQTTTWRKVKLGEVMKTPQPDVEKIKTSEYKRAGHIPIFDQGSESVAGYTDNMKAEYHGKLPAILFGDHTLILNLAKKPFALGADGVQVLEPEEPLFDRKFFYYALKGLKVKSYGYERHLKYLRELEITCPDINDQKRIASILSTFDNKIELNNKISKNLEQTAQAIFKEWFIKFKYPGHEKVKIVDSELGKIPEGWEAKNILEIVKRISVGKKYENETALPKGNVPILDQGQSGRIGFHNSEPGVIASLDEPVVVFTNHTCNYWLITYPFSAIQNVLPYVGINGYSTLFVYYLTCGKIKMQGYKGHWPEFEQQEFVIPPQKLAEEYSVIIEPIIKKIVEVENENKKLTALRDFLLPKLMSGEIRV